MPPVAVVRTEPGAEELTPSAPSVCAVCVRQALNIATKIVKGAIEIVNEVHLIKKVRFSSPLPSLAQH